MIQLDTFQTIFNGFNDISEKKYSIKYAKKDSKKDLSMLSVAPIIIIHPIVLKI